MSKTIFDKIVNDEMKSWKVWEDDDYLAFLTPFPNTPGFTVVIPKNNPGDNVFHIDDEVYHGLMDATKKVANILEKAFNVQRVAMIFEGEAVPHVHAKLMPMHGLGEPFQETKPEPKFHEQYPGYLTSLEGPKMDDETLNNIQAKILGVQK
jgi:histidine triad (HIT) family protein